MVPHVQAGAGEDEHVPQHQVDDGGRLLHLVQRDGADEGDREESGDADSHADSEPGAADGDQPGRVEEG